MVIMDSKGVPWAIYEKFEAMCLELEEVMCEDTVKFFENQAQTVGASAKKFYLDVMQDLLPPSCINPDKVAPVDISLNPYVNFGIYKKPKTNKKNNTIKIDKPVAENSKVLTGANTDYSSSLDHFQPPYSIGPVRGTGLELCLEQKEHRGLCKTKSQRSNNLPSEIPSSIPPMSKDLSQVSLCCEISENHEVAVDVTGCDSGLAKSSNNIDGSSIVPITDTSIGTAKPDTSLPVESGKETNVRGTSLNGGPDVLAAELNGSWTNNGVVSLVGSHNSSDQQCTESASEDHLSSEGDSNLNIIENGNGAIEPGLEIINEQFDKWKLEETCVLVDREKFCLVAHRKDKPKSYKKKIQKAFSSKRSARKQEYEQLAAQYTDMGIGSNQESAVDADTKKSITHGVCESEWELL